MPEERRAQFIIAQQFIEDGRLDEARYLLREMDGLPVAQAWADQLERGEPVDTDAYYWDPGMVRPRPTKLPKTPRQHPGQVAFRLLMAFMLLSPLVQMLTLRAPSGPPPEQAQQRGVARARVQALCNALVQDAIADARLQTPFGSCLDWSLSLPRAHMRDVLRCHERHTQNNYAFRRCVLEADIIPQDLLPRGQPA